MQTFLPYDSFSESAKCLDYRRLGKQRVEAWQIYRALTVKDYGWKNHPIVKMWNGYEAALLFYGIEICKEWKRRGYNDTMLERFEQELLKYKEIVDPVWLGNKKFHASHRSNLLRKDKKFYSVYNWSEQDNLEYVWM